MGESVGSLEGTRVGAGVGALDGAAVGAGVGAAVGDAVGDAVGMPTHAVAPGTPAVHLPAPHASHAWYTSADWYFPDGQ